jgi:hypothetical protein
MRADLSQPTLGLLRRILEELQPEEYVEGDIVQFWRNELFDFGFAPTIIDVAASYSFKWSEIIPDLFVGRFGRQNSYFSDAMSPSLCEQTLKRLAAFGLFHSRGIALGDKFRKSLAEDGFDLKGNSNSDLSVPAEIQQKLNSPLSSTELEITNLVLDRFLNFHESSPRKPLVIKFSAPDVLDRLVQCSILKVQNREHYLPLSLAFHYSGNAASLDRAMKSVDFTLHVLQNLYRAEPDKPESHFTVEEVETHARKMYEKFEPDSLKLGLYLVQELSGVLDGWGCNTQRTELVFVRICERIVALDISAAWDELIGLRKNFIEREQLKKILPRDDQFRKDTATPSSKTIASAKMAERDTSDTPVAFISYSWDSDRHKQWVLALANRLQEHGGVKIILDRWHLIPGKDKNLFMEKSIADSEFVILICSRGYAGRADNRQGGVGYESTIITAQLAENIEQQKFIPVLREGDWKSSLPIWIKSKVGVDLSGDPYSDEQYHNLLRALHSAPLQPPPIGPKPIFEETPTLSLSLPPPNEDQSSWPDVILECQWPSLVHESRIPGSHIVRKRPWMLRHGGPGAVYNVHIHNIDFGEYKASFPFPVRTLTDTATVHPIICRKLDGKSDEAVVIATHDLESLIHNPPSGCDVGQYAVEVDGTEDEEIRLGDFVFEVEIPVAISYDDKNGNQFRIKYLLHYDTYMEKGEMIRTGKIEKIAPI